MEHLKMTECADAISNYDIESAEQEINIKFPEEYKDFLKVYNGGIPYPNTFSISKLNPENTNVIDKFLSLQEVVDVSFSQRENVPELYSDYMEIIALTWAAPVVCIGVGTENYGKIFHFEIGLDTVCIADSFREFINSLRQD